MLRIEGSTKYEGILFGHTEPVNPRPSGLLIQPVRCMRPHAYRFRFKDAEYKVPSVWVFGFSTPLGRL